MRVLRELFGPPVQPVTSLLPKLTFVQLEDAPEQSVTESRKSLGESDCTVSTNIDLEFPG